MKSAKPFVCEGKEQPTRFVDIEKGDEIKDARTQTKLEVPLRNQARASLITGIISIAMLILGAVYVVLAFIAFKNLRLGLAIGFSVSMGPFYIFTLMGLLVLRGILIESDGMRLSNTEGGNV